MCATFGVPSGQGGGELRACADVELLEDVGEVGLDGASGDVELLGDLAVGVAVGGEVRHAMLCGSQRLWAGERGTARAGAGRLQLVARAIGEQSHAAALGDVERLPQRGAGVGPAIGAPEGGADVDERSRMLELDRAGGEHRHRLCEQRHALVAVGGAGQGTQAGAERPREPESLGEREVPLGVPARSGGIAEGDERLGGVHAPRRQTRVDDVELLPKCGGADEIGVGVGGSVLGEPQARAALQQQR